jgi:hypothetical protein
VRVRVRAVLPYVEYMTGYNLRKCRCRSDWKDQPTDSPICKCGEGKCGSNVTPPFLTAAAGQALCSLVSETGYNCYADCAGDGEVKWYASPCGADGKEKCDPRIVNAASGGGDAPGPSPSPSKPPAPGVSVIPELGYDPAEVYDLRGLKCELLNGKEVRSRVAGGGLWDVRWLSPPRRPHPRPRSNASTRTRKGGSCAPRT